MHGGRRVDPQVQTYTGFTELGVETIPPMVARGVLLDVARFRGLPRLPQGAVVGAAELQATAEANCGQRAFEMADVAEATALRARDPDEYLRGPGMSAEASEWLAALDVLAVGADNVAWDATEVVEPHRGTLPGHLILLVRHGIYILENLLLEELAARGHHEFAFVCLPLKMVGATGSPVRPVAVVPA